MYLILRINLTYFFPDRQHPSFGPGDLVFGMHEHGLEGVHSLETNLYSGVLEDPLERFTHTWKIGDQNVELLLYFMSCVWVK